MYGGASPQINAWWGNPQINAGCPLNMFIWGKYIDLVPLAALFPQHYWYVLYAVK